MAEVHLARSAGAVGIAKLLVVKRVLPEHAADPKFVRLFLDEARLAVALDHPNVVQVYDVGEDDGSVFIAMEYLHGRDLRHVLRALAEKPLPIAQAVGIVIAACGGLHYAHEKRTPSGEPMLIVHRDVSPQNLFVRFDGVVKLIDFGIARATHQHDRTATGEIRGKFGYISPEQWLMRPLDRRTDIFSLAIVLYELTTGRRPFQGHDYAILKQVVETDAPPPSTFVSDYPAELERIVLKGLARDPVARYATAEALQMDLEAFARSLDLDTTPRGLSRFMRELYPDETTEPSLASPTVDLARADTVRVTRSPPVEATERVTETLPHTAGKSAFRRWGRSVGLGVALMIVAAVLLIRRTKSEEPPAVAPSAVRDAEPHVLVTSEPAPSAPPSAFASATTGGPAPSTTPSGRARATPKSPTTGPSHGRSPAEAKRRQVDPDGPLPH